MDYFKDVYYLIALAIPDGSTLAAWRLTCRLFRDMELDHLILKYVDYMRIFKEYFNTYENGIRVMLFLDAIQKCDAENIMKYGSGAGLLYLIAEIPLNTQQVALLHSLSNKHIESYLLDNMHVPFKIKKQIMEIPDSEARGTISEMLPLGIPFKLIGSGNEHPKIIFKGNISCSVSGLVKYFNNPDHIAYIADALEAQDSQDKYIEYIHYTGRQPGRREFVEKNIHLYIETIESGGDFNYYDNVSWDFIRAHPEIKWDYDILSYKSGIPWDFYNSTKKQGWNLEVVSDHLQFPPEKVLMNKKLTKFAHRINLAKKHSNNPIFTLDVILANPELNVADFTGNDNITSAIILKNLHLKWDHLSAGNKLLESMFLFQRGRT